MDPDYREALENQSKAKRERCKRDGHLFNDVGSCSACGEADSKPRVTLVAGAFRSVWFPKNKLVILERQGADALGVSRWDEIARYDEAKLPPHIYRFLTEGKPPEKGE